MNFEAQAGERAAKPSGKSGGEWWWFGGAEGKEECRQDGTALTDPGVYVSVPPTFPFPALDE